MYSKKRDIKKYAKNQMKVQRVSKYFTNYNLTNRVKFVATAPLTCATKDPNKQVPFTVLFLNRFQVFEGNVVPFFDIFSEGPTQRAFQAISACYDEFTCTGVSVKFMQVPNLSGNAYIQSQIIVDENTCWSGLNYNAILPDQYSSVQTESLNNKNSWTRYFSLTQLKTRLGISWCSSQDTNFTYYGQLQRTVNPSCSSQNTFVGTIANDEICAAVTVSWYYEFRNKRPTNQAVAQFPDNEKLCFDPIQYEYCELQLE